MARGRATLSRKTGSAVASAVERDALAMDVLRAQLELHLAARRSPGGGGNQDGGARRHRRYRQYTIEDIRRAVELVRDGATTQDAALVTKVPRETLRRYLVKLKDRPLSEIVQPHIGRTTLLPNEVESRLAKYASAELHFGRPLSRREIREEAGELAIALRRHPPVEGPATKAHLLSRRWLAGFKKRQESLGPRIPQPIDEHRTAPRTVVGLGPG